MSHLLAYANQYAQANGRLFDAADEMNSLYRGLEATIAKDSPLMERVTANGPRIVAHTGLVPGTKVKILNVSNAGFNGMQIHAERVDMPGQYLHLKAEDLDQMALVAATRGRLVR